MGRHLAPEKTEGLVILFSRQIISDISTDKTLGPWHIDSLLLTKIYLDAYPEALDLDDPIDIDSYVWIDLKPPEFGAPHILGMKSNLPNLLARSLS